VASMMMTSECMIVENTKVGTPIHPLHTPYTPPIHPYAPPIHPLYTPSECMIVENTKAGIEAATTPDTSPPYDGHLIPL